MLSNKSNKELIEAGHQFAKALDADMPLTEIAKLVSALATRLDCAIVRGDELQQKLDAMGHECGKMLGLLNDICRYHEECTHDDMMHALIPLEYVSAINTFVERDVDGENPFAATDAYLNSVRAEGVAMFAEELGSPYGDYDNRDYETGFNRAIEVSKNKAIKFANQLRFGTHDTEDKAEGIKPDSLTALPVERDQYGYWSHPDYLAFCDGREYIPSAEFNQWMEAKGLEWKVDYRDEEETDYDADGYDLSTWNPEAPAGDGWFVGSIHDTDDGAVCIWLRAKAGV